MQVPYTTTTLALCSQHGTVAQGCGMEPCPGASKEIEPFLSRSSASMISATWSSSGSCIRHTHACVLSMLYSIVH